MNDNYNDGKLLNIDDGEWLVDNGVLETCCISNREDVSIPNGVVEISAYAMSDNFDMRRLYIPRSVRVISGEAFYYCSNLEEIIIENPKINLKNGCFQGVTGLKCVYIGGQKVDLIVTQTQLWNGKDGNCIEKYVGAEENYKVDDDIIQIGTESFCENTTLKSVSIPDSVLEIEDRAFSDCESLQEVQLPQNLGVIGECAFENCRNVKTIRIPESVFNIRRGAFRGWTSKQTIYIYSYFKGSGIKFFQKWRKGCNARIVYY